MFLTPRQEKLINTIIERYVRTAEPVSSKSLVKSRFFRISSATVRNEMHDLEDKGYLAQFHTSGGRIPTDRAYRFYVDNLIGEDDIEIDPAIKRKVDYGLVPLGQDPWRISKGIATIVAELSDNAVIAGIPEEDDFYKIGLSSLFELPDFKEFDRAFRLTSFFEDFDRLFDRVEKEFFGLDSGNDDREALDIFIGRENKFAAVKDETVMTIRYNLPNQLVGSLTMIGPTRMDYRKNIGLIKYTADKLNKIYKNI